MLTGLSGPHLSLISHFNVWHTVSVGASVVGVDVGDNVVGVDVGVDVVGAGVGAPVGLGHRQVQENRAQVAELEPAVLR